MCRLIGFEAEGKKGSEMGGGGRVESGGEGRQGKGRGKNRGIENKGWNGLRAKLIKKGNKDKSRGKSLILEC